ncbi:hypothetical protein G6L26_006180 [Agrobacterium radiobacter]|jgi:hypothetical protein|uniref:Uncharacterized protein n=2 Tax=Agrobacterium tumefaciens complex TaxID=1183400 RepID=A0AAW8LM71_AGRTU|nr:MULTISPECIES: hypothetical protein [Agrobacterium]MCP2134706.1 hypothetical protein [Rhizobium sp. SLBN-94]KAB0462299.1 hypothetical protein F7R04_01550 [Agrobacterium tumefaciens]KWT80657.1 hypothetical protein ASH09_05310 [Agrobacterium radiobacter]KWT81480.1 hypothetical protein ASB65_15215 [Agrobacterium tumefaciens str. B6]MBB4489105.1 hypothetical protein [Agrobacterium radiobacter]
MKRLSTVQPPDCDMAIGCCDREEIASTGVGFLIAAASCRDGSKDIEKYPAETDRDCDPRPKGRPRAGLADYRF